MTTVRILSLVTNNESRFYKQQVAGLRDRGHTVDTLPVPSDRGVRGDTVTNRPISAYLRYYPRVVAAASGEYDLVHANYGLTAPPAIAQPFHPVVLTLWGSDLMGTYGRVGDICSRFADAVVVMSEEMAEAVSSECYVIPHGIDLELFRPIPQETVRSKLGWDPDTHHVLFPYATSRAVKDFPRAERIVKRARRELEDPIELQTVSGVDHTEMPQYMNAADALLLTSKREGLPNSVKEAMACDLPVVATDVGGVAQLLRGVSRSAVCDSDDDLVESLTDVLRAGEPSNGREKVAPIGLENQLNRIEHVYESII